MLLFLDIGGGEIFLILFVFLLLFGSEKIPEVARGLGKGIREFKDATEGIKREINDSITNVKKEADFSQEINSIKKDIDKVPDSIPEKKEQTDLVGKNDYTEK
ncbi:MAG TPA: twin-arginine translocase TatA/TatE family subunit [Bacteroidia bacterium]|nr:twin-arginine translocase TatA/TatE family subunit [Bacteroidia bacterium]